MRASRLVMMRYCAQGPHIQSDGRSGAGRNLRAREDEVVRLRALVLDINLQRVAQTS